MAGAPAQDLALRAHEAHVVRTELPRTIQGDRSAARNLGERAYRCIRLGVGRTRIAGTGVGGTRIAAIRRARIGRTRRQMPDGSIVGSCPDGPAALGDD